MSLKLFSLGATALALCACSRTAPPPPISSSLGGVVGRVGGLPIEPSLVADVAQAQHVTSQEALDSLIKDALCARAAHARGLDRDPEVLWLTTAALARRVPTHFLDEAREMGPPTDDELALVSVVHAVVQRTSSITEEDALVIAGAIRVAVLGARSADDFIARANAVRHTHALLTVEPLGPFSADGRDANGAVFEAGFVAAAFSLHAPRETTPIVVTPFGWHVIQLVERAVPGGPLDDRRRDLAADVTRLRARQRLDTLLRARLSAANVSVSVGADELMAAAAATGL